MGLFSRKMGLKEYVEQVVKPLVENPDKVSITEIEGERTTVLELRVGDGDLGKVIGKQGKTARAIRTLLAAASARAGQRTMLEILE